MWMKERKRRERNNNDIDGVYTIRGQNVLDVQCLYTIRDQNVLDEQCFLKNYWSNRRKRDWMKENDAGDSFDNEVFRVILDNTRREKE